MKENVGGWDRNARWAIGTGALLAALVAPLPRAWRAGLLTLAAAQFITASARYCPLNEMLGIDTRQSAGKEALDTSISLAT